MCFGSTGMFEQDDVENWVSLTTTAGGSMARRLLLNSRMGLFADGRPVVEALPAEASTVRDARRSATTSTTSASGSRCGPTISSPRPAASAAHETGTNGQIRKALPFNDTRHLQAHQFLVDEAYLLDAQQYEAWLDTLTDDVRYVMPVRVTTARGAGFDTSPGMAHFDEDKYSLSQRVARFATEHAWTEDPPSRLRHFITNVRTFECDDDDGAPDRRIGRTAVPQPGRRQRERLGVLRPRGPVALVR